MIFVNSGTPLWRFISLDPVCRTAFFFSGSALVCLAPHAQAEFLCLSAILVPLVEFSIPRLGKLAEK